VFCIKDAKAEAHMYHAAQHFIDEFDEYLEPQIIRTQEFLKRYTLLTSKPEVHDLI
jgi:hypothetical protein